MEIFHILQSQSDALKTEEIFQDADWENSSNQDKLPSDDSSEEPKCSRKLLRRRGKRKKVKPNQNYFILAESENRDIVNEVKPEDNFESSTDGEEAEEDVEESFAFRCDICELKFEFAEDAKKHSACHISTLR